MDMRRLSLLALVAVALITPPLHARGKKAPELAPGKYKGWGEDIDEVEIVKPFKAADYDTIAVMKFDTSATPLPDQKEKSYESMKSVLASYTDTLVEAVRDELKTKAKVDQTAAAPKSAKTLIIRGTVDEIEPGSRAGRMLVGYGAGSAATKVTGEIVDAKSGAVLVRFTQKRRSGGTFKFAGGNDVTIMRDAIHATGKDVAHIIDAFQ
jgi:hypothetical protein